MNTICSALTFSLSSIRQNC